MPRDRPIEWAVIVTLVDAFAAEVHAAVERARRDSRELLVVAAFPRHEARVALGDEGD